MLRDPIIKEYALESIESRQREREMIRDILKMRNEMVVVLEERDNRPAHDSRLFSQQEELLNGTNTETIISK